MRILVDIDGVLAEQVKPALDRYNLQYGTNLQKDQIESYNELVGGTDIAALIAEVDVMDRPVIEGAREAMAQLCELHHVMIVTSRPVSVMGKTEEWLKVNGIPYHSWMFTSDKGDVPGDALIDDCADHVEAFAAKDKRAILFSQPWNEGSEFSVRCRGWGEAVSQIEKWETLPW